MGRRALTGRIGVIALGVAVALAPAVVAGASSHHKKTTKHHKKAKTSSSGKGTTTTTAASKSGGTVKVGPLECPDPSFITQAAGTTFTGPAKTNGGTAACVYMDSATNELNVILDIPSETVAQFESTDPSLIGEPATPVPGIGKAAFETTTNGHAEVDVYQTTTKGFAVTLDPANLATVTPADLTEVEAVAKAYANR